MALTDREILKDHLIDKYRAMVADRYDFDKIKETLPPGLDEAITHDLRHYFLNYLYPPAAERRALDEAFTHLENYVTQPVKVWGILGNLAGAIFRFGGMLIDALKAGLVSLETHVAAKHFEEELLKGALKKKYTVPLTEEQFMECVVSIERRKIERFIDDLGKLFTAMSNTKLLGKTLEILNDVVKKMESKPRIYTKQEVDGIKLGISVLSNGYELFKDYPDSVKKQVVNYVVERERAFTASVYADV